MDTIDGRKTVSPFPRGYRGSGILLHVTSLPSPHGIGDFGPSAYAWVDRLVEAGQSWWQALPLGPTGVGNSPYQSLSTFAGNDLLISPEKLIEEGLVEGGECAGRFFPADRVDFPAVIKFKGFLVERAWSRFRARRFPDLQEAFDRFCGEQMHWLDDYALFRALKVQHQEAFFLEWPAKLIRRDPAALARARHDLASLVDRFRFEQFLVFRQADHLRAYASRKGLRLLGDLPFFVSLDSADVWANPELFLVDEHDRPRFVAGVPPDYFSAEGQFWGNPLYDWEAHRRSGYRWWLDRLRALLGHVDLIRLDHFRAFAAAWHIPAGASSAKVGQWLPGPGGTFFLQAQRDLGRLPFVAEDLGVITPDVRALRDQFHLPGMRVLQFAFDGDPDNPFLPHNYVANTVVYTGTHDNDTSRGWYETLPANQRRILWQYLKRSSGKAHEVAGELLRLAWSSRAALAVAPLQDLLNLGSGARMNIPGRLEGNWCWRCTEDLLCSGAFQWLRELTEKSGRAPSPRQGAYPKIPAGSPSVEEVIA